MCVDLDKLEGIVDTLNGEVLELIGDDSPINCEPFSLISNGSCQSLLFMGETVWDSEVDERLPNDDTADGFEELEGFVRRRMQAIVEVVARLKFAPTSV